MGNSVKKRINIHVDAIDKTINELKAGAPIIIDIQSMFAFRQTSKIIQMSLDAEKETSIINSQITLFLKILSDFIKDKKFEFSGGDLTIQAHGDRIHYDGLSSGEKQLLIIFIETLLQRQVPYVFLTDEPELSLHIDWQRKIIPAIMQLNPNAQVIAATHSPEVASKYKDFIIDMEDIVNV